MHLPVLVEAAEVVAGVAADHQLAVVGAADDVESLPDREHDRIVVGDALLEHRDPLLEAVGVLVAGLDVLHLAPARASRRAGRRASPARASARPPGAAPTSRRPAERARKRRPPTPPGVIFPGLARASAEHRRGLDLELEVLGQVPEAAELGRPALARASSTPRRRPSPGRSARRSRTRSRCSAHHSARRAGRARGGGREPRRGRRRRRPTRRSAAAGGPRRRRAATASTGRSSGSPRPAAPFITER